MATYDLDLAQITAADDGMGGILIGIPACATPPIEPPPEDAYVMPPWPKPNRIIPNPSNNRKEVVRIGPGGDVATFYEAFYPNATGQTPGFPLVCDGGRAIFLPNLDEDGQPIPYDTSVYAALLVDRFPSGVEICGEPGMARQTVLKADGLTNGKGILVSYVDLYVHDLSFINAGNPDVYSTASPYANPSCAVWWYHADPAGVPPPPRSIHLERCAIDGCMMGLFSPPDAGPDGNHFTLFLTDCDFGYHSPNGLGIDLKAHDTYVGSRMYLDRCNFYGSKWGVNLKSRGPGIFARDCYVCRHVNRWIDQPEGGELYFQRCQFLTHSCENSPLPGSSQDTILHVFEYAQMALNYAQTPMVVFDDCDVWGSRSKGSLGEDFMVGVDDGSTQLTFQNCRQHWFDDPDSAGPFFASVFLPKPNTLPGRPIDAYLIGFTMNKPAEQPYESLPPRPPARIDATRRQMEFPRRQLPRADFPRLTPPWS